MLWNTSPPEEEKQVGTGQVDLQAELIAQGNAVRAAVALVGDAGSGIGVQHVGRGLVCGSGEDIVALIGKVRQAEQLALDALDLRSDGGAIGGVDRTIGALDSQVNRLLQRRNHRAQCGIRTLYFALNTSDAALELVVLGGLGGILNQFGRRRRIVRRHVDGQPGTDLQLIGVDLLLCLRHIGD
jgi:hypothetical protein